MKSLAVLPFALLAAGCVTPMAPVQRYHAGGTEPFWALTITDRTVTFTQPDAPAVQDRTPKVIIGFAGEMYRTPRIDVNIVHARCSDGMSDRAYPDKVQVTVDGRRFDGCGGL